MVALLNCASCAGGSKPEWQGHTREWVHRNNPKGGRGTFSIVMCLDPPKAPDGGTVRMARGMAWVN